MIPGTMWLSELPNCLCASSKDERGSCASSDVHRSQLWNSSGVRPRYCCFWVGSRGNGWCFTWIPPESYACWNHGAPRAFVVSEMRWCLRHSPRAVRRGSSQTSKQLQLFCSQLRATTCLFYSSYFTRRLELPADNCCVPDPLQEWRAFSVLSLLFRKFPLLKVLKSVLSTLHGGLESQVLGISIARWNYWHRFAICFAVCPVSHSAA